MKHRCEVCELTDTDTEAVLMPTEVSRLFAMLEHHAGDPDAWPSVWVCADCEIATREVFRTLAGAPIGVLLELTPPLLADVCRMVRRQ